VLKYSAVSKDAGKIDRPVSIEWISLDEPCPPSVEKRLDTTHTVETVSEELECAADGQ
jgi:hypothetical protein